jgi:hypothetical protein
MWAQPSVMAQLPLAAPTWSSSLAPVALQPQFHPWTTVPQRALKSKLTAHIDATSPNPSAAKAYLVRFVLSP